MKSMWRLFTNISVLFSLVCLVSSCDDVVPAVNNGNVTRYEDFVYVENDKFHIEDADYFPVMLNYVVDYRSIDGKFVVSPAKYYEKTDGYEANTIEDVRKQLSSHFQLIRDMGFNSIRVCLDRFYPDDSRRYYYYTADGDKFSIEENAEMIIDGFETLVSVARDNGLRLMLLLKPCIDNEQLEKFNISILKRFSGESTVFAYDFMNEPLYFDRNMDGSDHPRTKDDAYRVVTSWKGLMREYAPHQLMTIGFSVPLEVLEWDPAMLPVDFVQVHSYHPLYFKNEVWWYSHYVGKPWMIGETALPADNDSISYEEQRLYMVETYKYTVDCGGAGYGWWEFQEMPNNHFEAQYGGLMTHDGYTLNSNNDTIVGTLKPAVAEIKGLSEYEGEEPKRAVNYYNMIGYNNLVIKGRVVDEDTKEPVEGAIIRGWNKWWSIGTNTYSDKNGNFTLYTNDFFVHFEISAPCMTKVKFDKEMEYFPIDKTKLWSLESLPMQDLEYHKVAYHVFLNKPEDRKLAHDSNDGFSVFDYDAAKFDKAKFYAEMGDVYLSKLDFVK